jgi:hypothetical protein
MLLYGCMAVADDDLLLLGPVPPDFRHDDGAVTVEHGNLVLVPAPISNPTLESGLVLGETYYHPQTQEQAATQPPSITAAGGMYTSSDSKAVGVMHRGYWSQGRWRFSVAGGLGDLNLSLVRPGGNPSVLDLDWWLKGHFVYAGMSRRVHEGWYVGAFWRNVQAEQLIRLETPVTEFDTSDKVSSVGLGIGLEFDSRDNTTNAYHGGNFKIQGLFNNQSLGSDKTYQSYSAALSSYHSMNDALVLAWELKACDRGGRVPLWDGCRIDLRGFSTTDYIAQTSASAQLEARWRLAGRWGVVGFAGAGYARTTFSQVREKELIPSYGLGLRFMVVPDKRLNVRLDFGRSTDDSAIHLSVGEAF